MRDLKIVLQNFFNGKRNSYKRGKFRIAIGGYDLFYEIYYNNIPIIQNIDGKLEVCTYDVDIDVNKVLEIVKEFKR